MAMRLTLALDTACNAWASLPGLVRRDDSEFLECFHVPPAARLTIYLFG